MSATSDIAQRAAEQASVLLDTLWPSDEQRVKEIIQSAIDESCAEKSAEIERLRRRLDLLDARILQLASDWAETSSDIRTSAKRVLPASEVDGDSTGVTPLEDVAEMLVQKVEELRRDAERYRWLRETTKAVHFNELWEKVDVDGFDAAVDAAIAARK